MPSHPAHRPGALRRPLTARSPGVAAVRHGPAVRGLAAAWRGLTALSHGAVGVGRGLAALSHGAVGVGRGLAALSHGAAEVGRGLAELVLPGRCAGCGAGQVPLRYGTCAGCVTLLEGLRPHQVSPYPVPVGLPRCVAVGAYEGALREVLLTYKERGRHPLARPLGALLAGAVVEALAGAGVPAGSAVVLVAVPSTAAARRRRHGDHLARLARHAAGRMRTAGWVVSVAHPVRALPRPDSAALDRAGRSAAAQASLQPRPRRLAALRRQAAGAAVVVVDDVVTTGCTVAAVTLRLAQGGVPVVAAATLAATRLRIGPAARVADSRRNTLGGRIPAKRPTNEG